MVDINGQIIDFTQLINEHIPTFVDRKENLTEKEEEETLFGFGSNLV